MPSTTDAPVSIVNADLVREISFYTGLFAGAEYASADKRFTVPARLRTDGCKLFGAHGW